MSKMTFAIDIPQELLQKLEEFGRYFDQSVNSQIVQAIERYIDEIELDLMAEALVI
jgi:predicted DNA-binding protein